MDSPLLLLASALAMLAAPGPTNALFAMMAFDSIVDAKRVLAVLGKRLARFGLTLHPDKTRLVDFRPQVTEGARHPETDGTSFDFLHGVRRSLVLIPAGAAGYLIAATLLGLALGPALAASPAAARILRLLIGAYLFVLAFRLWRKGSATDGRAAAVGAREVFVTTLLNPKALVF